MVKNDRRSRPVPRANAPHLELRLVELDVARRVTRRRPRVRDNWAIGYPSDGDIEAASSLLNDLAVGEDPGPFGPYEILIAEELVIGQVGFHAPPDRAGVVEVGYGIAESERNKGYATAALQAVLEIAFSLDVARVEARANPDNAASRRVMEKAGLSYVGVREGLVLYAITAASFALSSER